MCLSFSLDSLIFLSLTDLDGVSPLLLPCVEVDRVDAEDQVVRSVCHDAVMLFVIFPE